jgi:hypothetical protein
MASSEIAKLALSTLQYKASDNVENVLNHYETLITKGHRPLATLVEYDDIGSAS